MNTTTMLASAFLFCFAEGALAQSTDRVPDIEEGVTSSDVSAPIGLTDLSIERDKFSLPQFHIAKSLTKGEAKILGGIVVKHLPSPSDSKIQLAGVPETFQPQFDLTPLMEGTSLTTQQRGQLNSKLAIWASDYWGRSLNNAQKGQLKQLYEQSIQRPVLPVEQLDRRQRDAILREKSRDIAKLILDERRIFEHNIQASIERYGGKVKPLPQGVTEQKVADKITQFLKGDYIVRDRQKARQEKRNRERDNAKSAFSTDSKTPIFNTGTRIIGTTSDSAWRI